MLTFHFSLSQPRSRRDDENNFKENIGVTTIVYYGNLLKNLKRIVFETKFGFGSQLRVGKVLAPHNACLKTIPSLIKCARQNFDVQNICYSPKNQTKYKTNKKILKIKTFFFYCFGPKRIVPCSYVFSFGRSRIMQFFVKIFVV